MKKLIVIIFSISQIIYNTKASDILFAHLDVNDGLSQNHINCVFKDSKGFIWIGTMSGLNRYDGKSFKIFYSSPNDSNSLIDNFINNIYEDYYGTLWIYTRSGYCFFDPMMELFSANVPQYLKKIISSSDDIASVFFDNDKNLWLILNTNDILYFNFKNQKHKYLSSTKYKNIGNITSLAQDSKKNIWFINNYRVLFKIDINTFEITETFNTSSFQKNENNYYVMTIDSDDDIWFYNTNSPDGLYLFDINEKETVWFNQNTSYPKLNNNLIRGVLEEKKGIIWIGTDHGGINIYDKSKNKISYVLNNPDNENSISQNVVTCMYKDKDNIMWVGTFKKGLNYYHSNLLKFRHIKHESSNPNSLGYDDIDCFAEDKNGNLWIGTNNGGLFYYDRQKETFKNYKNNPDDPNSLSNNVIVDLYVDEEQKLWIGTYYGGLDCFDGSKFVHYKHDISNNTSISDDRVWDIFVDSEKNFWIATLGGGLNLFDKKNKVFYHYKTGQGNTVSSDYVLNIAEDKNKNLWIATANGIDVLDKKTLNFLHYKSIANDPGSLSNNNAICVLNDSRGLIWVGTREGLNLFLPEKKRFKRFYLNDGLSDNTIQTIVEDNIGNIWMGTPNGLTRLSLLKNQKGDYIFQFNKYDKSDGLQGKEFNEKACFKLSTGELVFGGSNGFNIFEPSQIRTNKLLPSVVIVDFQIFNQSIKVNQVFNNRILLTKSIVETDIITLKYKENVFSIEFAALNYLHPEKNQYLYKLEGFNNDWLKPDNGQYKVTYTNLDPGTYTFKVIASNDDGVWNYNGASLKIKVLPPFYRTIYAYVIYIVLIISILFLARRIIIERTRMKFVVENERKEAQRLHEMDMLKIKFFTNISHELRTPLTLIISPLEKILKTISEGEIKNQLMLMHRNAKRLLRLVNQLLDLRRMEVKEFSLNLQPGDLVAFVREVVYSFSDISDKQNIKFDFHSNIGSLNMLFDHDKIDKIMFNLLSNAFKFTDEGGKVSVEIFYTENNNNIQIKVKDTGIGIPKDRHEKIFEQFFQNPTPENIINQGSGVGLSLTKEFVKLHGGEISVESELGKGSCFNVTLPMIHKTSSVINAVSEEIPMDEFARELEEEWIKEKYKSTILIIEDNEDLRFYLKDNLRNHFNIIESGKGKDGLKKAFDLMPDLIVCDIMLPEIDGLSICRKIKEDKRTSHIPIILLTAKTDNEQKVEGFKLGADDYITKPFSFEILESRIRNLIAQREALRNKFHRTFEINPSNIEVVSLDEKFLQKALQLVEKNLSNSEFSVEEMSKELGMSRVHLYKKMVSLTGKTPIEFIRMIRLKRAAQLLKSSQLTIAEISYNVGFNNPKYFARYFKDEYGVLPSLYAKQNNE